MPLKIIHVASNFQQKDWVLHFLSIIFTFRKQCCQIYYITSSSPQNELSPAPQKGVIPPEKFPIVQN